MRVLYNETDTYCCDWMENLMEAGLIASGIVDRRSIKELTPDDLKDVTQAHFFAGTGMWGYALRWLPAGFPVWTGSCPCQPWSSALRWGRRRGTADSRHLWPAWFDLIRVCRPPIVLGEQVSSKAGLRWFDSVSADLEGEGYSVAAADLCAASVGAPHRRQRLYWVACLSMGDPNSDRTGQHPRELPLDEEKHEERTSICDHRPDDTGVYDRWSDVEWLQCSDGRSRPIGAGIHALVDGYPERRAQLRAIGNAIVPQLAEEFARAAISSILDDDRVGAC